MSEKHPALSGTTTHRMHESVSLDRTKKMQEDIPAIFFLFHSLPSMTSKLNRRCRESTDVDSWLRVDSQLIIHLILLLSAAHRFVPGIGLWYKKRPLRRHSVSIVWIQLFVYFPAVFVLVCIYLMTDVNRNSLNTCHSSFHWMNLYICPLPENVALWSSWLFE